MLRGHRIERFAAITFCAFTIFGALALVIFISFLLGGQAYERSHQPHEHAQTIKHYAERACIGGAPATVFECVYDTVETSEETARAEQDLTAQQQAAWGTMVATGLSFVALLATMAALYYVRETLIATLKAVEDTSAATEAMKEANALAEDTAIRQLRAYIILDAARVKVEDGVVSAYLRFKNTGVTPATHVRTAVGIVPQFQFNPTFPIPFPDTGNESETMVGPNLPNIMEGSLVLDEPHRWGWDNNMSCIWVVGQTEYQDVYRKPRKTTFKLMYAPQLGLADNIPAAARDGNEMT